MLLIVMWTFFHPPTFCERTEGHHLHSSDPPLVKSAARIGGATWRRSATRKHTYPGLVNVNSLRTGKSTSCLIWVNIVTINLWAMASIAIGYVNVYQAGYRQFHTLLWEFSPFSVWFFNSSDSWTWLKTSIHHRMGPPSYKLAYKPH